MHKLPIEAYPNQPDFKLNPTAIEFSPGQSKLDPAMLSPYAKPFTPDAQNIQLSPAAKPFTPIKDIGLSPLAKPFVPVTTGKMPDFSLGASVKEIDFKETRKEQTAKIRTAPTNYPTSHHLEDFHTL